MRTHNALPLFNHRNPGPVRSLRPALCGHWGCIQSPVQQSTRKQNTAKEGPIAIKEIEKWRRRLLDPLRKGKYVLGCGHMDQRNDILLGYLLLELQCSKGEGIHREDITKWLNARTHTVSTTLHPHLLIIITLGQCAHCMPRPYVAIGVALKC